MAQKRIADFFGKPQQYKRRCNREVEEADSQPTPSTPETTKTAEAPPDCDDQDRECVDRSCAPAIQANVPGQKAKISEAPHQPTSCSFPGRPFGKETFCRSFNVSWFTKWRWLHYIEDGDRVVCFSSVKAVEKGLIKEESVQLDSCFVKGSFTNWRKATEKFKEHEKSKLHSDAVQKTLL